MKIIDDMLTIPEILKIKRIMDNARGYDYKVELDLNEARLKKDGE